MNDLDRFPTLPKKERNRIEAALPCVVIEAKPGELGVAPD